MKKRIGFLRFLPAFLFLFQIVAPLAALEVVYLKNGDVILGTLIGPVSGGLSYQCFGEQRTIPITDIDLTEKNLQNLSQKAVYVVLKDGSVIQGKIVDYDEDIGVFLDISFGTLTMPTASIQRIYEKEKSAQYMGAGYQVSGFGGAYFPFGPSAEFFGLSWCAGAGFDWSIPQVRGLYASASLIVYGMDYLPDDVITYGMVSLRPEMTYKYLGWRMNKDFLSKIVPYASVGIGMVYIAITDPSSYPASFGNITADAAVTLGIEFAVIDGIVAKLSGTGDVILQNGSPFFSAGVMLGIGYEQ
jgi:small nuclear ribonucleoprotein (snRNP)-like protein